MLCTSGTAAANFHPAVLEAHHGRVPLIVCTADRPPELRDTGAGQTIDQVKLYGDAVRWFFDAGRARRRARRRRRRGARSRRASVPRRSARPPGPVHLNLPFREPLVPDRRAARRRARAARRPPVDGARAAARACPTAAMLDALAARSSRDAPRRARRRGLGRGASTPTTSMRVRRGRGLAGARRPDLGPPRARARSRPTTRCCAIPAFAGGAPPRRWCCGSARRSRARPRRSGSTPTSPQVLVDPDGAWLDPPHAASEPDASPTPSRCSTRSPTRSSGHRRRRVARARGERRRAARARAIDELLDGWDEPFEGRVARDVVAALPDGATLVVASSMPVRDVECFAAPRDGLRVLANRGVNGIDGFVSTVLGVAAAHDGPDGRAARRPVLPARHQRPARCAPTRLDATFVVVDNDGGGIFSFLPQAELPEHFETLFGTPQGVDLAALAAVHGLPVGRGRPRPTLVPAVLESIAAGGVRMVLVRTDRDRERRTATASLGRGSAARGTVYGRTSAASIGSSFAWVSAHSASGSDPATMPAPAWSTARAPSSSAPRSAMAHSPSPRASTQPTGPGVAAAVDPRGLELAIERGGAAVGVPPTAGRRVQQPGERQRAERGAGRRQPTARSVVARCASVPEHAATSGPSTTRDALAHQRASSASTIASTTKRCSAVSLADAARRQARRRPATVVPASGRDSTSSPGAATSSSGLAPTKPVARVDEATRLVGAAAAGRCRADVERRVGLDEDLACEHDLVDRAACDRVEHARRPSRPHAGRDIPRPHRRTREGAGLHRVGHVRATAPTR